MQPPGDVTCDWAGPDGLFGTPDDSRFTTPATTDGAFSIAALPYGAFSCRAVTTTGLASAVASATVTSPAPAQVALPLPGATQTNRLPVTGSANVSTMARRSPCIIGAGLLAATRRRPQP